MKKVVQLLSWRDWGILRYNSFWQNIAALFFISLEMRSFSGKFFVDSLGFILFSTLMTGVGYLINDLADLELDRRHGKSNAFKSLSPSKASLVIACVFLLGALFSLPFWGRPAFLILWALWIGLAVIYSFPPLRLKEKGLPGLLVTILAQQTLPTALIFAAFGELTSPAALVFIGFSTVRGISSDASHQMRDYVNDVQTGTGTFAVRAGLPVLQKIYAASLELERLALFGLLVFLALRLPSLVLGSLSLNLGLPLLVFSPLCIFFIGKSWAAYKSGRLGQHDPYDESRQAAGRDIFHIAHHTLPSVILPLYLGLILMVYFPPAIFYVLVLVFLHRLYLPATWFKSFSLSKLIGHFRSVL